jgi:alkanesulfonate monooxygenase SsuD/methylene tetrahydromethanopterin reductase-like flavin-dependent oxidoreductase (luciferase family)
MSFGCSANSIAPQHIAEFAQRAEEVGYDRLVFGEHFQDGNPPIPRLLSLPVLAAAAAATKRIRVMTGIDCTAVPPGDARQLVATVDQIPTVASTASDQRAAWDSYRIRHPECAG